MRSLGATGIELSPIGAGCWTIGGPWHRDGRPFGWGEVDDDEAVFALRIAFDEGITLFDTADVYGCGHSERLVGRALAKVRDQVIIATKFGRVFNESTREVLGARADRAYVFQACEASLRRLGTDRIDLYQFHLGNHPADEVGEVIGALEDLVDRGFIRAYGWSTDDPDRARAFAVGPGCAAIQHERNLLREARVMRELCDERGLTPLARSPLAMGLLTGKYGPARRPGRDDVRSHEWDWTTSALADALATSGRVMELLREGRRTNAQACLSWLLSTDPNVVPIVGFRSPEQVRENAATLRQALFSADLIDEIRRLLQADDPPDALARR